MAEKISMHFIVWFHLFFTETDENTDKPHERKVLLNDYLTTCPEEKPFTTSARFREQMETHSSRRGYLLTVNRTNGKEYFIISKNSML